MDHDRFDTIVRTLTRGGALSRKQFLAVAAGLAASGAAGLAGLDPAAATRKRRKNRGKPKKGGGSGDGGTCEGSCQSDDDCGSLDCVCSTLALATGSGGDGQCVQREFCDGVCDDNADCGYAKEGDCVCFFGKDVDVAQVSGETFGKGFCAACRGKDETCDASTECCGQLVCRDNRTCGPKPRTKAKKNDRCSSHGGSCRADKDCCAQAVCYKGRCGEKDTHCKSNGECAKGFSCVGGRYTASHRRCRRKARPRPQRKRNRG